MPAADRRVAWTVIALALVACGGSAAETRAKGPPPRAATSGDDLVDLLPAGADAVAEIDVARLRQNAAVADVVAALRKHAVSGFDPLGSIDVAVAAAYRVGASDAATVFVLRGAALALPDSILTGGELLDEHTFVYGPRPERERFHDATPRLAADAGFMALRARAMPERASGSVLRMTARLDRDARIAAAGKLGVDELPATVSAWLDLADDVALVALLGGDDESDAVRLAGGVKTAAARAERVLPQWIPHGRSGGELTATTTGRTCRVVWLLGPRHLGAWAKATALRLSREGT